MSGQSFALAALLLPAACRAGVQAAPDRSVEVVLAGEPDSPRVEARGLPPVAEPEGGWPALFELSVASARRAGGSAAPAVLGRYESRAGVLVFEPRFALEPELEYTVVLRRALLPGAAGDEPDLVRSLVVPRARPAVTPVVQAVYPTARPLPANLLKLYVHFSRPMARGFAYRHTRILEASGAPVERPFLELGEELWNPDATRLTLLVDPGRIKRGLLLHEQLGPVLEPSASYALVVEAGWPGADGAQLASDVRLPFTTTTPDLDPPDPMRWELELPRAFTREPLAVALDEPLDHALLQHMIRVVPIDGPALAGDVTVDASEARWSFVPQSPWTPVAHTLSVDPELEDLAGNSVGRPFEVRIGAASPTAARAPVGIPFRPLP